jgi:AcrR family transcriptional regulator
MSDIAEATGIGRATLYKYFLDLETILSAWHQRQVEAHLADSRSNYSSASRTEKVRRHLSEAPPPPWRRRASGGAAPQCGGPQIAAPAT